MLNSIYFPQKISETATADHLWAYIAGKLLNEELRPFSASLQEDLENGRALLILDGLDEVPYPEGKLKERQAQLIGLAQSLHNRYSRSRVIVASRPYAYKGWELPGYTAVNISDFEDNHRIELANRLYRAFGLGQEEAKAKAESLNEQLDEIDWELKDRPLFVTLMATLYLKGGERGLPARKGTLYRESIMLLLDRWTCSRPGAPSLVDILGDKTVKDLYHRLAALAYKAQETSGNRSETQEIGRSILYKYFRPLGNFIPDTVISYLSENAGLLVSPGQNEDEEIFQFAHRSFQEYLAAEYLVELYEKEKNFRKVVEIITTKPETWRVACTFVGDVLADTERRVDLWQLLGNLLENDPPEINDDPRWWLVWLAATVAKEQELHAQENLNRRTELPILEGLVEWSVKLLETPQALPPVERAMCGRVLSQLGDPRPGVGLRADGLPDILWCNITAPRRGSFIMGANDLSNNPRRIEKMVYSFKMAKYMITYRQFQSFIESEDYTNPTWWLGFPDEYQQQLLRKQYFKYDNHPRDRVSWYQAVAFTRWLTARYRSGYLIGSVEEIRLPSEIEWEYAARSIDENIYPYGNIFNEAKANTDETGIGMTSAVGCFVDGSSPFGVQDLSGNLWEWCLNKYYKSWVTKVDASGDSRVLRGGSVSNNSSYSKSAFRGMDLPDNDHGYVGFRVVLSALKSQL